VQGPFLSQEQLQLAYPHAIGYLHDNENGNVDGEDEEGEVESDDSSEEVEILGGLGTAIVGKTPKKPRAGTSGSGGTRSGTSGSGGMKTQISSLMDLTSTVLTRMTTPATQQAPVIVAPVQPAMTFEQQQILNQQQRDLLDRQIKLEELKLQNRQDK
jgi:hypothetical protein